MDRATPNSAVKRTYAEMELPSVVPDSPAAHVRPPGVFAALTLATVFQRRVYTPR